jgi:hypothetical protein
VCVRAVLVRRQELRREVVHDLGGLGGRDEADNAAVAEEAQVPVVRDDVYRAAPCDLRGRGLALADVIVRADVAPVEGMRGRKRDICCQEEE